MFIQKQIKEVIAVSNLYRGIFWVKDIESLEIVVIKAECKYDGFFVEIPDSKLLSKSGKEFNHQSAWRTLPKSMTDNKSFNYYPRGRVEIRKGKAVIYANGNIANDDLREWAVKEFNLTKENSIESVAVKADMSKHYLCYLDCKIGEEEGKI